MRCIYYVQRYLTCLIVYQINEMQIKVAAQLFKYQAVGVTLN